MCKPSPIGLNTLFDFFLYSSTNKEKGITIVGSSSQQQFISYQELYTKAIQYLSFFKSNGIKIGDELIINSSNNKQGEFFYSFWDSRRRAHIQQCHNRS